MTPAETTKLLTFLAGLDPRLAPRDDNEARLRIAAWTDVLAPVTYENAKAAVSRHYRSEQQWPMKVGDIYQACKPNPKWTERGDLPELAGRPIPPDVREEINALLGRDPREIAARRIPCPWSACRASVGDPCNLPSGTSHPSRIDASAVAA